MLTNKSEKEMIDSSLSFNLDIDATLTDAEYKLRLEEIMIPVLRERFKDVPQKQKVKKYSNRVSFACPFCGDSMQNMSEKRGSIILTGKYANSYKCFNCGEFMPLTKFFRELDLIVDLPIANYISTNNQTSHNHHYDISMVYDIDEIEALAIPRQFLRSRFKFMECQGIPDLENWLHYRLLFDFSHFMYDAFTNSLVILNMTPSGAIIGFQKRRFVVEEGQGRFQTFILSEIYKKCKMDSSKISDEMDTLSNLFGICQLDFSKPITLFEGPIDRLMFPNSVGSGGANKTMPDGVKFRFWYDHDKTGKKHTLTEINKEGDVFLWTKFINTYDLPNRKKWDLNDVMMYFKSQGVDFPIAEFENYFSGDDSDLMSLMDA